MPTRLDRNSLVKTRTPTSIARPGSPRRRRVVEGVLVAIGLLVLLDALFGERGLIEMMRARQQYREAAASLKAVRAENERLREDNELLTYDPATIEGIARQDLGLIKPGELMFIIRDTPAAETETPPAEPVAPPAQPPAQK
jgi:cell division protein FtsB